MVLAINVADGTHILHACIDILYPYHNCVNVAGSEAL